MQQRAPIGALLAQPGVAVRTGPADKPGGFRGVRLLPGDALEAALPQLRQLLAEAVLADPPHAMRWMWGHPHRVRQRRWAGKQATCISKTAATAAAWPAGHYPAATTKGEHTHPLFPLPCCACCLVAQATFVHCMTDPLADASAALARMELGEEERAGVLALRGLLACGVLEHCLQMRHLVDYGVNR